MDQKYAETDQKKETEQITKNFKLLLTTRNGTKKWGEGLKTEQKTKNFKLLLKTGNGPKKWLNG